MFFFKKKVSLEGFCRDFYDHMILNPLVGRINVGEAFFDVIIKNITEADPTFDRVNRKKLETELTALRFELFALAWTHKYINGKAVLIQSRFTKNYLLGSGKGFIWKSMENYNQAIGGATLHWLTKLGKVNLPFNYHMKKDLTVQNIDIAKELGIVRDESVKRANNRLWSENAWRQKDILSFITPVLIKELGFKLDELNEKAQFVLATVLYGFYEGARQSWKDVKIVFPNMTM